MQKRHLFRAFSLLIALTLLLLNDVSKSSAFLGGDNLQQTPYEKLNLLILVKASQSSNWILDENLLAKTRLQIIQDSISSFLEQHSLPSNVNLGIMAYGHLIDRTDISLSCSVNNVELVVPFQPASSDIDLENFLAIIGRGYVPAAVALEEAGKQFPPPSPDVLNVILLIADGSDTCNGAPEEVARELADSKNIVIHTIGFMADGIANKELKVIADLTSGTFQSTSPYTGDNQLAKSGLTSALSTVFDDLLTQISIPTQSNTLSLTVVSTSTPTFTNTPKPTNTLTETPTQLLPAPTLTGSIPTEEPPLFPIGTSGIFFISVFFLAILGIGVWFWRSRIYPEVIAKPIEKVSIAKPDEILEKFKKDLFEAYDSVEAKKHYPKFIPLESVKKELSSKYPQEQLDNLLTRIRRKYPDNVWIDRDDKTQPVYIKIVR
jgi:hypothetical protein